MGCTTLNNYLKRRSGARLMDGFVLCVMCYAMGPPSEWEGRNAVLTGGGTAVLWGTAVRLGGTAILTEWGCRAVAPPGVKFLFF